MHSLSLWAALVGLLVAATASAFEYPSDYVLSSQWDLNAPPQHRNFTLTVTNTTGTPDGYVRPVIAINGQFPGPLIEANANDTLSITVVNMMDTGLTMHWHGLYQNGTNWEDGVAGITQCPILPGNSYTYTFSLNGQFGTYWYHSHEAATTADGVLGPLIIHSPDDPLVRGRDFDDDQIIVLADWFHNTSEVIVGALQTPQGYNNNVASPPPNSILFNGQGYFDCSWTEPSGRCVNVSRPEIHLRPDVRTRIRWVGGSTHAMIRASIDEHPLEVIEADGTGIKGPDVHRIPVFAGQRYSTIVTTSAGDAGRNLWMRGSAIPGCWAYWTTGDMTGLAIVRVSDENGNLPTGTPRTIDWTDPSTGGTCQDPTPKGMVPLIPIDVPKEFAGRAFFKTEFALPTPTGLMQYPFPSPVPPGQPAFFANNVSFVDYPWEPLLFDLIKGGSGYINETRVTTITTGGPQWWELVIVNKDTVVPHPYHLHAMDMYIVYEGKGDPTEEELDKLPLNLKNPLRRDTLTLDSQQFAVVRFRADIAGVWFLHCHVGWHLAVGKAGVIVVEPKQIYNFDIPQAARDLCALAPGNASAVTEPGRRFRRSAESVTMIDMRPRLIEAAPESSRHRVF